MKIKIRFLTMFIVHGSFAIALPINATNFSTVSIRTTRSPAIQKANETEMIIGFIIFVFFR